MVFECIYEISIIQPTKKKKLKLNNMNSKYWSKQLIELVLIKTYATNF